jgi:hypothetical protein
VLLAHTFVTTKRLNKRLLSPRNLVRQKNQSFCLLYFVTRSPMVIRAIRAAQHCSACARKRKQIKIAYGLYHTVVPSLSRLNHTFLFKRKALLHNLLYIQLISFLSGYLMTVVKSTMMCMNVFQHRWYVYGRMRFGNLVAILTIFRER